MHSPVSGSTGAFMGIGTHWFPMASVTTKADPSQGSKGISKSDMVFYFLWKCLETEGFGD